MIGPPVPPKCLIRAPLGGSRRVARRVAPPGLADLGKRAAKLPAGLCAREGARKAALVAHGMSVPYSRDLVALQARLREDPPISQRPCNNSPSSKSYLRG